MADPQGPTETARMSVRPLWCPSMWLIDTQGREPFEQICGDCGIEPHHMLDSSQWVELEKAGAFLERVRSLADTEQAFHEVCAHRIREGYGPLLHVLPVATPRLLFRAVARTVSLFSNVSRGSVLHESRTHSVLRYHSSMPELETRELCLTRVAAMTDLPNLFGLPPALIKENACIARGDEYCEYECRFYTRNRWLPMVGGVVVGGAIAYGLDVAGIDPSLGWSSLPVVFGLLGAIWELRKTAAANVDHGQRIQAALEELAENEGDARREILAFHQRQKEWG
ncbi:MAG: hypothetical protein KC619_02745, partial [Myxococcales bacterium]|nr:hypothetical protein [Myxococcales bacterium]